MAAVARLTDFSTPDAKTVTLAWEAPGLPDAFKTTRLAFRYDVDVSLTADMAGFMFLNLVVPCYAKMTDVAFEVQFPEPIDRAMAEHLLQYHGLTHVKVSEDCLTTRLLKLTDPTDAPPKYALFYGGGKDSLLSAALHDEIYGAKNCSLLRLVWDVDAERVSKKRSIFSEAMSFMEEKGFGTQFVESDFHINVIDRQVGKAPNIALYPGAMAPLLNIEKFTQIAHGYDVGHFHQPRYDGGRMPFANVRPEALRRLSDGISKAFDRKVSIKNFNYGFNAGVAFKALARGFPEYVRNIYMCERLGSKWCIKCRKCFLYAISCLAYRQESDFSLGYFFENSIYIKELLSQSNEVFSKDHASIPYIKKFAYPTHLCSTVQVVKDIDLDYAKSVVSHRRYPDAFDNLMAIIGPYREYSFPEYDAFWVKAYDEDAAWLGNDPDGAQRQKIAAFLHRCEIPISYKSTFDGFNMETPVRYAFGVS